MKPLIGVATVLVLLAAAPTPAASTPTAYAAPTRYEAENTPATCDGTIDSDHSGFSGTGFCNTPNATGAAVQFTVNAASAGTATLGIRYANGGTDDRPGTINGGATVGFPSTGAWSTWSTATTTIQVSAGANTIRLAATTSAGLANIDYLDFEVSGPNPRHEAEDAACDGTIDSNHSGFSGTGFCNTPNAVGAWVEFTVNAASAGTATLGIRYANGGTTDRPGTVNGGATVGFPSTDAWSTWSTATTTIQVNAGANTIRLAATTSAGLANIDYLDFEMGGPNPPTGRKMEKLGRGVVAVRSSNSNVLVSWRLLGLDPSGIGFNVYRSAAGGSPVKLNTSVLTGGTNFVDSTANLSQSNAYHVRPVIGGAEQAPSGSFTLSANHATEPVVRVPLRSGGPVKFVWVGDLDGDGEYDYVLDRQTSPQSIEAYRRDGQFLWSVNMGPNSTDQNNIEGGSATIDVGHNDGVTVYDLDSDGRAEVAVRIANGVRFGNGTTYNALPNNTRQAIAILDGMTGAPRAIAPVPTDYLSDGPMYARFGIGHLDGINPSLVAYMKNRVGSGSFNLMYTAWRFTGNSLTMQWKFLRGSQNLPDGHNTRIIDVDGDGRDELGEIGFLLNGDGTLRYSLAPQGIVHGDRWFITDIDPARPGLEGYGIQQDHRDGMLDYYYDADTGRMIWQHRTNAPGADAGRGMVADIDPRHAGMETWSFNGEVNYTSTPNGLYNAATNRLVEPDTRKQPWPHMGVWWDGDLLRELFSNEPTPDNRDARIVKWDPANPSDPWAVPRQVTFSQYGAVTALGNSVYPTLIADILGDWREDVVLLSPEFDELVIFTTDRATDTRLYTLAHNPAYRNSMTLKGYLQSGNVDYFLGNGMAPPPRPDIVYTG